MANTKVQLKENGNNIFPNPNLVGIDTTNILADLNNLSTYTCQVDCMACVRVSGGKNIKLNNIEIATSGSGYSQCLTILLKKNDILSSDGVFQSNSRIFAIKY